MTASNGQEAIEIVTRQESLNETERYFDIIFLDLDMPIKSGYEAVKEINAFY